METKTDLEALALWATLDGDADALRELWPALESRAETKIDVPLGGSWEQVQRELQRELSDAFHQVDAGDGGAVPSDIENYVSVDATFDDRVVCTVTNRAEAGNYGSTTFVVPWLQNFDGSITLGQAQEVDVTAVLTPIAGEKADEFTPPDDSHYLLADGSVATLGEDGAPAEFKVGKVLARSIHGRINQAHSLLGECLDMSSSDGHGDKGEDEGDEIKGDGDAEPESEPTLQEQEDDADEAASERPEPGGAHDEPGEEAPVAGDDGETDLSIMDDELAAMVLENRRLGIDA